AVFKEYIFQQLRGRLRIHDRSGRNDLPQALFALEHDQYAGFALGHIAARLDRRIDRSLDRNRVVGRDQQAAEIAFAELLEQAAQLGLENDDRRRDAEAQRVSQDERNRVQPRQRGYQENEQQPD